MIHAGDVNLADTNDEVRRRVLVLSNAQFEKLTGRVLVAPEIETQAGDVLFPWQVRIGSSVYALELLRSMSSERLLRRIDRATAEAMASVRRALLRIT